MAIQAPAPTKKRVRPPFPCEDHEPQGMERLFIGQEVTVFRRFEGDIPPGITTHDSLGGIALSIIILLRDVWKKESVLQKVLLRIKEEVKQKNHSKEEN